jgi:PPM family protein phosphatase
VADVVDIDYGQTQPILAGAVSGYDDQVAPPDTAAGRASAFNPRRDEAKRIAAELEPPAPKVRSKRRAIIAAVLLLLLVLAGVAIGRAMVRSNYYVGQHDDTVAIMRGVQGSFLGYALQEPYLLGCLNPRNELSLISFGQSRDRLDCRPLKVDDLRPSEREQVKGGLPAGTLDEAITQINQLVRDSLLPPCAPRASAPANPKPPPPPSPTPNPVPPPPPNPAPAQPESPDGGASAQPPPAAEPSPAPPPVPLPTVTALPPSPPEPGVSCRAVA